MRPGSGPGGAAGDDGFDEILTALDLLSARAEALEARREATLGALLDRPDLLFKLFHIRAEGLAAAGAGQQRLTFELSELGLGLLAALRAGEVELGRVEIHRMRPLGDVREAATPKVSFLALSDRTPDVLFEDDPRLVAAWRAEGLVCFQVADGPPAFRHAAATRPAWRPRPALLTTHGRRR